MSSIARKMARPPAPWASISVQSTSNRTSRAAGGALAGAAHVSAGGSSPGCRRRPSEPSAGLVRGRLRLDQQQRHVGRVAHLLGEAAQHDALEGAVAVCSHGDQVALERLGLLDGRLGRLAPTDQFAHGEAPALEPRRHRGRAPPGRLRSRGSWCRACGSGRRAAARLPSERPRPAPSRARARRRRPASRRGDEDAPVESHFTTPSGRRSGTAGTRSAR